MTIGATGSEAIMVWVITREHNANIASVKVLLTR